VELNEKWLLPQLAAMQQRRSAQELQLRENIGRDAAARVEQLAHQHGLYAKSYGRGINTVQVVSVSQLPNYRPDLDHRQ
jgi:hypothetical protein